MEVTFRKAKLEDLKEIIELCNECFEENTSIEYAEKVFIETMNDKNQIYLVGIINNKIIAHSKITIIPTIYEKMNTYSILNHVCVKPEYRRYHIATYMLDACEKISKEMGCVCIELWSNNFRQPAHECYKKYGFIVNDAKFFSKEI
ncbi:MAG: GNAT family N-acetyltransferase [Clostridium sp.]|nr:GNAT family N-acetyltransferase [Clostridium sp.]MCM1443913.1 GNAT family N-acetyltransferase [Candidatus Amulumruptor caecigallinarius]